MVRFGIVALAFLLVCFRTGKAEIGEFDREKLGLSQEEMGIVRILNLSTSKVKKLLESGITLQEYADHPWHAIGIPEEEWIAGRRKGLSDDEMKSMRIKPESENGLVLLSFLLPGYGQYHMNQKAKSYVLAGIAVSSATMFLFHKKKIQTGAPNGEWQRQGIYLGIYFLDCLASSGDIFYQTRFADNPDLKRFSLSADPAAQRLCLNYRW